MSSKILSDADIKRRKKIQAHISAATGTLGLAALGGTLAATKKANPKVIAGLKRVGMKNPENHFSSEHLKEHTAPILATSAGISGVGNFNFSRYTESEARKRQPSTVVKMADYTSPFEDGYYGEVSKGVGDWKTIDQRERTQTRDRKTMRGAAAGAGVGAGLATVGYHNGDKKAYQRAGQSVKTVENWRLMRHGMDRLAGNLTNERKSQTNRRAAKAFATTGPETFGRLSASGKAGVATVAGAATVGAAAKGHHTYQQHKINQRRRNNVKKSNSLSAFGISHD